MSDNVFNTKYLHKLNNPERFREVPPDLIWKDLNLKAPKVAIDIGAGTGFFTKEFLRKMPEGKIFACDISNTMLDWMKKNIVPEHPNIIPKKMSHDILPCEKEIADLVYMINLHHEIENHKKLLSEIYRVLNPSGKLFIVDWKKQVMDQGPPIHIRFEIDEVRAQLEEAGFSRINLNDSFPNHFFVIAEK
ncbi:MAG: class I SAM-dependent methyltransferase [Fidelibacterota bacterium]